MINGDELENRAADEVFYSRSEGVITGDVGYGEGLRGRGIGIAGRVHGEGGRGTGEG